MESKGFDGDAKRTYYTILKVRPKDVIFCAVLPALALLGVLGV
jgi:energy-coupling factor transporter transmembrane protein EcfT